LNGLPEREERKGAEQGGGEGKLRKEKKRRGKLLGRWVIRWGEGM